jgi:hypothetical protein
MKPPKDHVKINADATFDDDTLEVTTGESLETTMASL